MPSCCVPRCSSMEPVVKLAANDGWTGRFCVECAIEYEAGGYRRTESDTPGTVRNLVVTDERDRIGDHVTTRIPTEYARETRSLAPARTCRGVESCGHVVTPPDSTEFQGGNEWSRPKKRVVTPSYVPPGDVQRLRATWPGGLEREPGVPWQIAFLGHIVKTTRRPYYCGICGGKLGGSRMEIDHRIPLSRGGRHHVDNLQWVHKTCNAKKGARPPDGDEDVR